MMISESHILNSPSLDSHPVNLVHSRRLLWQNSLCRLPFVNLVHFVAKKS